MEIPAVCYQPSMRLYTGRRLEANHEDCERLRKIKQRGMVRWKVSVVTRFAYQGKTQRSLLPHTII
jgi:hypothetical protein